MASITKRTSSRGVSYKITVSMGTDAKGDQIRHYMTWKPEPGMNARQAEKKVKQVAADFERELEYGYRPDNKQTFEEYSQYVIDLKADTGNSRNTKRIKVNYREKLLPYLGHRKITDIRPMEISLALRDLSKPGKSPLKGSATALPGLRETIIAHSGTVARFWHESGISKSTIDTACSGERVSLQTADRITEMIGKPRDSLFSVNQANTSLSAATIRRIYDFLNIVFSQAEKEMIITINPVRHVDPPKFEKPQVNYFQPEQITAILKALEPECIMWKTLVHMLIVTGARRGEIIGLKWEKVDFGRGQILIDNSLQYYRGTGVEDSPTKTRKSRIVRLPAETMQILRTYRIWQLERRIMLGDQWTESPYVFTQEHGGPISPCGVNYWLNKFAKKNGLPHINPHAFRHSAASILIANGVDVVSVSKLLGHSRPSMTMDVYSHQIEEAASRATESIADTFFRKKA